jgi:hypothetical protein
LKIRDVREYEEDGEVLVAVPLGPKAKGYAVIELIEFEKLKYLGLSGNWFEGRDSNVRAAAAKAPSGYVSVARILVDAGEFEQVRYQDGDKTNLKRGNISKVWHSRAGMKRDRDYLSSRTSEAAKA